MCGIFGYIGNKEIEAASMAHKALCELEYRGYDSWGIATSTPKGIFTKKAVGKISDTSVDAFVHIHSQMAIGHSRWATHGNVTEINSHPHLNYDGTIAVVHNGIIENHLELRSFLIQQFALPEGELFISETDTEVIPHLIDHFVRQGKSFEDALMEAAKMLEGRYAIVAMKKGEEYLLAVRNGSPLILGKDANGHYLASDVPAFLDYTRTVTYPNDGEYLKIFHNHIYVKKFKNGISVSPIWTHVAWDKGSASKNGHPHFMLKEILEQPIAIDKAMQQDTARLIDIAQKINASPHVYLVGCGTASKIAELAELYIAQIGKKQTRAIVGSEFKTYEKFFNSESLLFAISQSGETADVLEALCAGKEHGATIYSLLNVMGSSVNRMSKETLFINTGPEIAVASTKAATAQIVVMILLAHAIGNKIEEGKLLMHELMPKLHEWVNLELSRKMFSIAEKLIHTNDLYIIGRGLSAPIAREAAIKIQEVSYIHAEGFSGGELKHGPIALIQKNTPIIALMPTDETLRDMQSNTAELKCRGAYVIGIGPKYNALFDEWIMTPDLGLASPIASIIPIQLLAYHLGVLRGNNPDKPRNLAKSVTVK